MRHGSTIGTSDVGRGLSGRCTSALSLACLDEARRQRSGFYFAQFGDIVCAVREGTIRHARIGGITHAIGNNLTHHFGDFAYRGTARVAVCRRLGPGTRRYSWRRSGRYFDSRPLRQDLNQPKGASLNTLTGDALCAYQSLRSCRRADASPFHLCKAWELLLTVDVLIGLNRSCLHGTQIFEVSGERCEERDA
jgi:hypothetical protein